MNTRWTTTVKATLAALTLAGSASTAHASYLDLLNTLEQNQAINAEQAAELRGKAPRQIVRPASGVVRDLQIRGRIHTQVGYVDAKNDEGSDDYSTLEVRRVRLGLRGTLFDHVRAQLEANLVPGSDLSMRSAFLQWRQFKPAYIRVGYDKPHSSLEENTSSAEILTIERTLINSLVAAPGPLNGVALDGEYALLTYGAGLYTDRDNRNPGGAESRYLYNAMAGLKLDEWVGAVDKLRLQGIYLMSDDAAGKVGSRFDEVITAAVEMEIGPFGLRGEYFLADQDGQDTKGFYVMPSFYLTDKLQAVVRYEQAESDKTRGIRAPGRYTRDVPALKVREIQDEAGEAAGSFDPQAGDQYQALYAGLNYYLSGHAHKLMLGVEMAELKNTDAGTLETTTLTAAWRMLF